MIIAEGTKNGKRVKIKYGEGIFFFNGKVNYFYQEKINYELSKRHPIGGTYYPEKESILNVLNVIENWFFDRPVNAEVIDEDIQEIPSEGKVY